MYTRKRLSFDDEKIPQKIDTLPRKQFRSYQSASSPNHLTSNNASMSDFIMSNGLICDYNHYIKYGESTICRFKSRDDNPIRNFRLIGKLKKVPSMFLGGCQICLFANQYQPSIGKKLQKDILIVKLLMLVWKYFKQN